MVEFLEISDKHRFVNFISGYVLLIGAGYLLKGDNKNGLRKTHGQTICSTG